MKIAIISKRILADQLLNNSINNIKLFHIPEES